MKPLILSDVSTSDELVQIISSAPHRGNLCVVMFTASWCGPCKRIKMDIYNDLKEGGISTDYKNVSFFYVDIDHNKLAEEFKIKSVPVFYFLTAKNGGIEFVSEKIAGANRERLINSIDAGLQSIN